MTTYALKRVIIIQHMRNGPEQSFYAVFDKKRNEIIEIADDFIQSSDIF